MIRIALVIALLAGLALARSDARAEDGPSSRAVAVRQDLQRILAGPDYARPAPAPTLFARIAKWLRDTWDQLMRKLRLPRLSLPGGLGGELALLRPVLLGVLFAAMAMLIAMAAVRLIRVLSLRTPGARNSRRAPGWEPEESADADPDDWLAVADRLARDHDWRGAYRAAFVSLLIRLDREGAIRFRKGRTNGDYLRELSARPPLLGALMPFALTFDAVWYGRAQATSEDYDGLVGAHRLLDPQDGATT